MKKEMKMRRTAKMTAKTAAVGLTLAAMLAGSGCSGGSGKYNSMMKSAEEYVQNSDYDSALNCYDIAAKLEPKKAAPLVKMAEVYEEEGDYAKADELIEQAILLAPDNANIYLAKMNLKLKSGNGYDAYDAMMYAKECGKIEVTSEEYVQMAALLTGEGYAKEAVDCFSNVSVSDLTPEQQTSYWYALKMTGNEDMIASLGLSAPGSEKMPANFDEQFQNGTLTLTKTQIGEEVFGENGILFSTSPDGRYGLFVGMASPSSSFLYDFEQKSKITIWADTANSAEGTQEDVENFVAKYGNSMLYTSQWSSNGEYLIVDFGLISHAFGIDTNLVGMYLIDTETGGCRAVKKYIGNMEDSKQAPFCYCTTDPSGDNIYYLEKNISERTYVLKKLNINSGEEELISEMPQNTEYWDPSSLIYTVSGKIVELFEDGNDNTAKLLIWEKNNDVWQQSEMKLCSRELAGDNNSILISDSGRGIYKASYGTIVFDVDSKEDPYIITGMPQEELTVTSVLDAENKVNKNFQIFSYIGLLPDANYMMVGTEKETVYDDSGRGTYIYDYYIIDLKTGQKQVLEDPANCPMHWMVCLPTGQVYLGDGIYSFGE